MVSNITSDPRPVKAKRRAQTHAKKRPAPKATAPSRLPAKATGATSGRAGHFPRSARVHRLPTVLFVDDEADLLAHTIGLGLRGVVNAVFRGPEQLEARDVWSAHVVMVDFDLAYWLHPNAATASHALKPTTQVANQRPQDGLALIGALRGITDPQSRPTAYAVFTGNALKLPGHMPLSGREHLLAQAYGVEWIFEKSENNLGTRLFALAEGVRDLPELMDTNNASVDTLAADMLRLPALATWRDEAREQVMASEPPRRATIQATQGIALLRWLLQGILPYPTFLLNERHLAARLRVTPISLRRVLQRNSALTRYFATARYTGPLDSFAGARWWRAGVESLIWALTTGNPDPAALRAALKRKAPTLEASETVQPVVGLSEVLCETDEQISVNAALEVRPEGWPSYADPAWIAVELVADYPDLRALIVARDLDRAPELAL